MSAENQATAGILRLSGLAPGRVRVRIEPAATDAFRVVADGETIDITATGAGAALAGYARLARASGAGLVSRSGVRALDHVPTASVEARAVHPRRVAYNITVAGYTTPFYDWSQWERELDLLAASGITEAHLTLGQESVWLETFQRFGYAEAEMLAWIVPPSHQPWQWLNNIHSYGGGTTRELIERRADLARRVIERMRELDIAPIVPGFSGTVPPRFDERHEGAEIVPQGKWFMDVTGPERPDWLRTDGEAYARVADAFYGVQRELFGTHGSWAVDLLHEGGKIGDATVTGAAHGVEQAMLRADPEYVWYVQAWAGNPRQELLDAIDREHVVILDLTGLSWSTLDSFGGTPWTWGVLPNYGGRQGLYGDLSAIAAAPGTFRTASVGSLQGITDMAEGVANNPVVWDLFHDLAWAHEPIDLETWLATWVRARYGTDDARALEAWTSLRASAYGPWRYPQSGAVPVETAIALAGRPVDAAHLEPLETPGVEALATDDEDLAHVFAFYSGTDSVIAAVPSVHANQAGIMGPRALGYEPGAIVPALRALVQASVPRSSAHDYDLVDVGRQVLDDEARVLLPRIAAATEVADFDSLAALFLRIVDAQEALLATHPEFLLGRWVADARAWGETPAEQAQLVREARRLLTSWGDGPDDVPLMEYANRSWSGLVGDYYRSRWARWFEQVRHAMTGEPTTPIDWFGEAVEWATRDAELRTEPTGDSLERAREVLRLVEELRG